jgi:hypothetical protein
MAAWMSFERCRRFPELTQTLLHGEAALVVVYNNRDATIGTELGEPFLFLDVLADVDTLPCVLLSHL